MAAVDVELMLGDLRRLVEVESPSRDLAALTASAAVVVGVIEQRLGGRATVIDGPAGPHVHWSGGGAPRVLLLGHHDTVFPLGTLQQRPFTLENGRARGPGVFDMLGGLVQAIHAIAALEDRSGVELLITADEEIGSVTSRTLLEEQALACEAVLVLEGAGEGGAVKTARKGCGTFTITVTGRAAHAGLEPHLGVNALIEAAHQLLEITALSRPALGTTVTPTLAQAGTAENTVPAEASITIDVRVETAEEGRRVQDAIRALTTHVPGAVIDVRGAINRPPMPAHASRQLFALATNLLSGLQGRAVGGASDGNFTAALGIPTLDGLGAVGGGAHADDEYLLVDAMTERAILLAELINAIRLQPATRPGLYEESAEKRFRS